MELKLFDTQYAFLTEEANTACWIGGRGCGKTFLLALWVTKQCMEYPGVRGVVASSTNAQLRDRTIPDFLEVFDQLGLEYKNSMWDMTCEFGNGSRFRWQSCEVAEERVKGGNLGFLAADEIDGCPETHISHMSLAVRHKIGSRQRRFVGNSPPPKHWIGKWFKPETALSIGRRVRGPLFQSSMFENYLLPQDFIDQALIDNPPGTVEYRRWILGEMDVPLEGLVYREMDAKHLITMADVPPRTEWVGFVYGLDLGANHYTVLLKGVLTADDKLYIIGEYAARDDLLRVHAAGMHRLLEGGTVYCDHDAQDRLELAALGISTVPATKDRAVGIDLVKARFRDDKLFIVADACPLLMSQLPYYVWDESKDEPVKRSKDVPSFDGPDAMRYMVAGLDCDYDRLDVDYSALDDQFSNNSILLR